MMATSPVPLENLQFGSTDPFLPGITLVVPNLPDTSAAFTKAFEQYYLSDDARSQYRTVLGALEELTEPWERFFLLSLSTAGGHELRHFHELMGSHFGVHVLSDLLLNAINLPIAVTAMRDEPVIGVPLSTWMTLPERLHTILRAQSRGGTFRLRPPEPVGTIALLAEQALIRIRTLFTTTRVSGFFGFSTRHLLEGSAFSVQKALISQLFETSMLQAYLERFAEYDRQNVYSGIEELVSGIMPEYRLSPAALNALIFFSLCGDWWDGPKDPKNRAPDRFMDFVLNIRLAKIDPGTIGPGELLDRLAERLAVPPLRESLTTSVTQFARFLEGMKSTVSTVFGKLGLPKAVAAYHRLYEQCDAAHRYMTGQILADPDTFFDPDRYLNQAPRWLAAPRWYRQDPYLFFREHPALHFGESFGEGDWLLPGYAQVPDDPRQYAVIMLSKYPTTGKVILTPETIYQFGIDNYLGNLFWANSFEDPRDEKFALQLLKTQMAEKELLLIRM